MQETSGAVEVIVFGTPYVVSMVGLVLAWRFNRSKVFFILLTLVLAYWSVGSVVGTNPLFKPAFIDDRFIQSALCFLLPLGLLVFSSTKERGIFTSRGLYRFGFVAGQALFVYVLWNYAGESAISYLRTGLWPTIPGLQTRLTDAGIVLLLATLLVILYRLTTLHTTLDYGLFATTLVVGLLLHTWNASTLTWWFTGAAGILVIALVQDAYRKAYVDELTGLPGRRSMEEYFLKLNNMYTVAMVDIDHFKKCNDLYGHDVGDQVLRMIAAFLARVERGGKAFRYGGEEFAIVFPGKEVEDVKSALDILRQSIADNQFVIRSFFRGRTRPEEPPVRQNQKQISITVSIGCANKSAEDYLPVDVIKRADKALYQAKESGRNQVRSA